jgi:hypothetical protein
MKHAIVLAILAATIPLTAAEKKETSTPPPAAQQQDSPLVAAAKRAGRLNKKPTFVITNETLSQMNAGRVTTTAVQRDFVTPLALPPLTPTPEMQAAEQAAKQQQARDKVADQQKKQELARMAKAQQRAEGENNYLDQDPAAAGRVQDPAAAGAMEQMTTKSAEQPTTKPSERPPQN